MSKSTVEDMSTFLKGITAYCLVLTVYCTLARAYPPGWSDDIQINNDTTYEQHSPDLCTDTQNNVWVTLHTVNFMDGEIYCSKRDSLGTEIIPETNISNNVSHSRFSRVVVDSSNNAHLLDIR